MFIKRFFVNNFRVFGENGVEIIFKQGVNAIIGENNSGKTALIDAIRIAFSAVPYRKEIYFSKSDFHVNSRGDQAKSSQMDIYLENVPKSLIEIWNPEEPTAGEIHLRFYLEVTLGGVEKVKYKAWGGKVEGNALSSNTFDAINIAFLGALRDAESEMRPSRSSRLANLLTAVTTDETKQIELINILKKANSSIIEMEPITKTKKIINDNLSDIEQDLLQQQVDIGLVEPRFESITSSLRSWIVPRWYFVGRDFPIFQQLFDNCAKAKLARLIHLTEGGAYFDIDGYLQSEIPIIEHDKILLLALKSHSFELYQNGLGYNNLLFTSTVLGDMSLNRSGIYLNLFTIEEPEAHLHPQLQELLHNFFERKHNDSQSIQVIYTSHSPTLVSRIGIEAINLLYEYDHSICCYPLANASLSAIEKNYLGKYLDVTKSQMFFAKGILFVEGISEALLLPEMAKILDRPFDKFAVELVNVDGTSFSPFAKILSLPSGGKAFAKAAIITDDDRCTDNQDYGTYIQKELDYDTDLADLLERLNNGEPSDRFNIINTLCSATSIELCGARKTLEYELSLIPNNIPYMLEAIMEVFPKAGVALKALVEKETIPKIAHCEYGCSFACAIKVKVV